MSHKVEVYSTTYCPYCDKAKNLLKAKGISYQEIDVTNDLELRQKLVEKAQGRKTVPQIFINDQHIGGFDDLDNCEKTGELDRMLKS